MKLKINSFVKLLLSSLILTVTLVFLGCENNSLDTEKVRYSDNILSVSDCKNNLGDLKSTFDSDKPCVTLTTIDGNYLAIEHINAIFNCIYDKITIDFSVVDNVITVKENEEGANAFCTCKYDIDYKIGPFDYGHYTINIQDESENNVLSFDFDFTANTLVSFCNE